MLRDVDVGVTTLVATLSAIEVFDDGRVALNEPTRRRVWSLSTDREISAASAPPDLDAKREVRPAETADTVSPHGRYIERPMWTGTDQTPTGVYIVDRNTAETLLSLEHGARRFDDAERWLAVESDEILEIYDLRVASDPAYKKPLVGLDHVRLTKFHAGGRLVSVTGSVSGEVTGDALIPLDLELTKRFAKWLARPRALSKAEACAYLPERHDCDYVPVLPNSKPSGKGQAGASANK